MRPWIMLRIASVAALLHFAAHTFGVVLTAPRGAEELAVFEAMKSSWRSSGCQGVSWTEEEADSSERNRSREQ